MEILPTLKWFTYTGNTSSQFFDPIPSSLQEYFQLGQFLSSWSGHAKRYSKGVASLKEIKQHYVLKQE